MDNQMHCRNNECGPDKFFRWSLMLEKMSVSPSLTSSPCWGLFLTEGQSLAVMAKLESVIKSIPRCEGFSFLYTFPLFS